MKFKRHCKREEGIAQITLVPFMDVVLQLLLLILLISSLSFQTGMPLKLPKAITSNVIKTGHLIITISSENIIYLNAKVLTIEELKKELLRSENKDLPILIKCDRRASVGRIVDVWDLCRKSGIERINIATDKE